MQIQILIFFFCPSIFFCLFQACVYPVSDGWYEYVKAGALCSPWVTWILMNMIFHAFWVSCLTVCQLYQVSLGPVSQTASYIRLVWVSCLTVCQLYQVSLGPVSQTASYIRLVWVSYLTVCQLYQVSLGILPHSLPAISG